MTTYHDVVCMKEFFRSAACLIFVCFFSAPALADCTLPPGAMCEGGPCASLTRAEGHLLYNEDHNTYQVCENTVWKKIYAIGLWGCPNGYLMENDRCYRVLTGTADWTTARTQCQATGGDLASANDAQEMTIINTLRNGASVWLGYSDAAVQSTWEWLDASSTYTDWASGQPDGGAGEDCGAVRWDSGGQIVDRPCAELAGPICEAPRLVQTSGLVGPSGCKNIGDLCADGTVFAGWHPISYSHLFIPTADQQRPGAPGVYIMMWKNGAAADDITSDSIIDGQVNHTNRAGAIGDFPPFQACEDLSFGGHTDWYLPSQVELYYLWSVRGVIEAAGNITNFQSAIYWASTEFSNTHAWSAAFTNGNQNNNFKSNSYRVRCVRR